LRQFEQRKRAPAGNGRKSTSRCALWPHRWHSMKMVVAPRAMRELYAVWPPSQQTRLGHTVCPSMKESAMGTEWVLVLLLKVGEYEMSTIPGFVSEQRCREAGEQWKVEANKFRGISGGQYLCLRKNNS
jgi:hypothetical protein